MEPVTHLLTGACLARTGWHRRVAYATAAMAVAAEFPDIDTLWSLRGPVAGFEHHRGITHTFIGVPFEAALVLLGVYALHWAQDRRRSRRSSVSASSASGPVARSRAPVRWGLLYVLLLLALLSHLLLDFTNNYGLRPFFPFNDRWYAGSLVFIFDPLLFLFLLAGLVLPALFRLIGTEVGARHERSPGSGWARAALVGVLLLWGVRWYEHQQAVALAQNQTLRAPGDPGSAPLAPSASVSPQPLAEQAAPEEHRALLGAQRSLASPDPLSIFRWYTVTDFGPAYRLGVADTQRGSFDPGATFIKPEPTPTVLVAERSRLGRIYVDWSPMPILRVSRGAPNNGAPDHLEDLDLPAGVHATVSFLDPRFMGDTPLLHRGEGPPPLSGEVVLDSAGRVIAEGMDGHFGR